ncbi:MAG: class I SAM-dependent methyltransferase, partial [Halobacteriota archaeon]
VDLVRGDVRSPPIGSVDGVLATFVVTLFDDPAAVVETWWELLEPGGRLAMLNVGPIRGTLGRWVNPALQVGLWLSTPTADRLDDDLVGVLHERVMAAHERLADRAVHVEYEEHAGLVRLVIGTKAVT